MKKKLPIALKANFLRLNLHQFTQKKRQLKADFINHFGENIIANFMVNR